jgi:hypothetical protein
MQPHGRASHIFEPKGDTDMIPNSKSYFTGEQNIAVGNETIAHI